MNAPFRHEWLRSAFGLPGEWFKAGLDLLYPSICPICLVRLHPSEQTVCDPCRDGMLPRDTWRCSHCGATGTEHRPDPGCPCIFCPAPEAPYRGVLASTHYHAKTARCIHLFKYDRRMEMGVLMADIMVARLSEPLRALEGRIGWIVPVPLHWRRRLERGFNQSEVLAVGLSKSLSLPLVPALRRIRHTKMQTRIPKEKRADNVKNAFRLSRKISAPLPGILLVDDVVTTAHTITECARVLAQAGAPQVWVASFARA